jgi:hypothetical protein
MNIKKRLSHYLSKAPRLFFLKNGIGQSTLKIAPQRRHDDLPECSQPGTAVNRFWI